MFEAGQDAAAEAMVREVLEQDIPAMREQLGLATIQIGIQLAGMIVEHAPLLVGGYGQRGNGAGTQYWPLSGLLNQNVKDDIWNSIRKSI